MNIHRKIFSLLITRIEVYNFSIKHKNVVLTRLARWYDEVDIWKSLISLTDVQQTLLMNPLMLK